MLRIAVPNKGSLAEPAADMLREAGYRGRRDSKELILADVDNDVEFFFLRPRDIAVYVGSGTLDLGITGRDLLLDSGSRADEVMQLGFARSTFRFAARPGIADSVKDVDGLRVATSYAGLVSAHLTEQGVNGDVVRLDGAVETAITLGVADVIADVVETGTTLRNQGLEVFGEPILRSEAVLIGRQDSTNQAAIDVLRPPAAGSPDRTQLRDDGLRRPRRAGRAGLRPHARPGVADRVPAARQGLRRRTGDGPAHGTNQVMDELYELGARAILVTDIAACRL